MKLVIDIPEEVYKSIQNNDYCGISNPDMYKAIANGTPLPTDPVDRVTIKEYLDSYNTIKTEQEPCEDAVSRQAAIVALDDRMSSLENVDMQIAMGFAKGITHELPPVTPQPKMGKCKDCKYFECNSVAKVDGIPLIVAHEICSRWGNGCKTKEDGYCFLFEPKMQGVSPSGKAREFDSRIS